MSTVSSTCGGSGVCSMPTVAEPTTEDPWARMTRSPISMPEPRRASTSTLSWTLEAAPMEIGARRVARSSAKGST